LRGIAVGFHFADKIAQGSLGLCAMLVVFVPIVRPQGEKDAYGNEDDLEKQVDECSSMFRRAGSWARSSPGVGRYFKLPGGKQNGVEPTFESFRELASY
jgi:hypothetical protein